MPDILNDPTIINIVSWAIFGFLAGLVAHLIDPASVRGGVLGTTITGIVGALLGGFLANMIFGFEISGFNVQSFLIAIGGALLLAVIERLLFRKTGHIKTPTERLK